MTGCVGAFPVKGLLACIFCPFCYGHVSIRTARLHPEGLPGCNATTIQEVGLVTQAAFALLLIAAVLAVGIGWALWRRPDTRPAFWRALRDAGLITLAAIAAIVIGAVAAWNAFFTAFHNLFFADGTWQFLYSDTLIRLFPEQFWFDSAITIGLFTGLIALAFVICGTRKLASASA